MTTIFLDKENHTVGHTGPLKAAPKTPFSKRAGTVRTPFAAKTKENNNTYPTGKASIAEGGTKSKSPFKTPNEKRIPLGGKDTNARTMQTKPQKTIAKQTSGRRRVKPAIKPVITKETTITSVESIADDDFPDIEYMPPRGEELPFIPDDYEELDLIALRDILNDGSIIADYHYPRDNGGMTSMERKLNGIFNNPDNEYIPNDLNFLPADEAGLRDFEKPLRFEGDATQWEDLGYR
ncbi:uncharacterized protein V1513DRAFT_438739 [Lipomyces chichibuensis]|uniref:uncharacterized protein n=1 Tax=Lipomyces chichibuensis TaxID=1546026 RepID=UPI00334345F7